MKNGSLGILAGLGVAALVTVLVAADPPASILRNSFTTNSPAQWPGLLSTTTSFMKPVAKREGAADTTIYQGGGFGFNDKILVWTNNYYLNTNALPVGNQIDVSKASQSTNCSANPTFSSLIGVTNGLGFGTVVDIQANGSDRTLSITIPNVHVYPSGTLVVTNGSFAILSIGGIGGTYTGAVVLPFP